MIAMLDFGQVNPGIYAALATHIITNNAAKRGAPGTCRVGAPRQHPHQAPSTPLLPLSGLPSVALSVTSSACLTR